MSKIGRLEIKQLRIFHALLKERNVSRVASQIGLTQQAVSDQLRKLRDIFDDRLFVRASTGLIPTPFADGLNEKLEEILAGLEGLLTPDCFEPPNFKGTYCIAASDYAQQAVLPGLLTKIRQQAPGLAITITDFDRGNLQELMETSKTNLAITFADHVPKSYSYLTLFKEHHVCVVSKKSPLAKQRFSLESIAGKPQVAVSPSKGKFRGSVDALFETAGLMRNIVISAPCFSLVPGYLEATDVIGFLPSRILPNDKLVQLDLVEQPEDFEVIATWHSSTNQDPLHNWIIGLLKEQYAASVGVVE